MYLPKPISDFLAYAEIKPACGGMSSANVYRCRIFKKENRKEGKNLNIPLRPSGKAGGEEFQEKSVIYADTEIYYLKTEPWSEAVENEHRLYRWLYEGKRLPVPEPLFCVEAENYVREKNCLEEGNYAEEKNCMEERSCAEEKNCMKKENYAKEKNCKKDNCEKELSADGKRSDEKRKYGYLLIREAKGEILRSRKYYADPVRLAGLAAEGIRLLWQVDIKDCPVRVSLEEKLKLAGKRLECGGYGKLDASVPYTKNFKNHAEVYDFLVKNQPDIEPVFTHGDYCLNNFFTDGEHVTAFIDFGNGGVGDAYQDIALCIREFIKHCPKAIPYFYEQIGIDKPDEEKLRYYMLLDELF